MYLIFCDTNVTYTVNNKFAWFYIRFTMLTINVHRFLMVFGNRD